MQGKRKTTDWLVALEALGRPSEADLDEMARALNSPRRKHICGVELSLADELRGTCPGCGAEVSGNSRITPVAAGALLSDLQARRQAMGLDGDP